MGQKFGRYTKKQWWSQKCQIATFPALSQLLMSKCLKSNVVDLSKEEKTNNFAGLTNYFQKQSRMKLESRNWGNTSRNTPSSTPTNTLLHLTTTKNSSRWWLNHWTAETDLLLLKIGSNSHRKTSKTKFRNWSANSKIYSPKALKRQTMGHWTADVLESKRSNEKNAHKKSKDVLRRWKTRWQAQWVADPEATFCYFITI